MTTPASGRWPQGMPQRRPPFSRQELQVMALACGADNAGIVSIGHQEPGAQRDREYPSWSSQPCRPFRVLFDEGVG